MTNDTSNEQMRLALLKLQGDAETCQRTGQFFGDLADSVSLVTKLVHELMQRGTSETKANLGPREPDNDMVICPNCTCQFVAIPVNVQARLQPFIGDVRRALFNGEPVHDGWVREITAAMELKGFIESTSQHNERQRSALKTDGDVRHVLPTIEKAP